MQMRADAAQFVDLEDEEFKSTQIVPKTGKELAENKGKIIIKENGIKKISLRPIIVLQPKT